MFNRVLDLQLMHEAWARLGKYFPDLSRFFLVQRDPESGYYELVLYVDIPSDWSYERAKKQMNLFDEEFWLDHCANAGFAVTWEWVD